MSSQHIVNLQSSICGLSLKTQELTAIFLAARLLCSVVGVDIHTVLDFATLVSTLWVIYIIRFRLKADKDDFPRYYLLVPAAVLAILVQPKSYIYLLFVRILWAFGVYLESVSVLPQLRMMQKAKMIEPFTAYYMFALSISRFFGLAYWALQVYERGPLLIKARYIWPLVVFLAEIVQTFIFAGLCYYYMKRPAREEALNWTSEMDGRSLLEEQDKGNRVDGIRTSSGLQNVARACGKGSTSDTNMFPVDAAFSKKVKKRTTTETIEKQTEVFQAGIIGLTEALKEGIMILKETRPRVYGEEDVYQELIAIGVPKYRLVDSMVYLTKNPSEVRALFGVPSALRKEMLFKLMNK